MRRKYDESFKLMAIELVESGKTIVSVAEDLGINSDLLGKWRRQYKKQGASSFVGGQKVLSEEEKEILRLKRELRSVREERDILKKAVSIFSTSDKKGTNS